MRIGIDLYSFRPTSSDGVSTFSLGLAVGLSECIRGKGSVVILTSAKNDKQLRERLDADSFDFFCVPVSIFARYINRIMWLLSFCFKIYRIRYWYERSFRTRLSRKIEEHVDALIVPTTVFNFFDLVIPTILCVHDIQQEFMPENFTLHQHALRWGSYRLSCDRATEIQVSSRYIKNCLLEKFNFLNEGKIFMAPEGVDRSKFSPESPDARPNFFPSANAEKFVFYPAQIWKHKNHAYLIDALVEYKHRMGKEFACVLTGGDYGYWKALAELISQSGLNEVVYLGRVDMTELLWIYKNCAAVLALGLHESSSLPIREGATFGKPLICIDIEPNLEAREYLNINVVNHDNHEDLVDILIQLESDDSSLRKVALGNLERLKKLEWSTIAHTYLDRISIINSSNHATL